MRTVLRIFCCRLVVIIDSSEFSNDLCSLIEMFFVQYGIVTPNSCILDLKVGYFPSVTYRRA